MKRGVWLVVACIIVFCHAALAGPPHPHDFFEEIHSSSKIKRTAHARGSQFSGKGGRLDREEEHG